jgi:hypothetical protein
MGILRFGMRDDVAGKWESSGEGEGFLLVGREGLLID